MGSCRLRRLTSWKAALLRGALAPRQSRQSHIVSCFRIASPFHTRQKLPSLRATFPRGGEGFMGELLPPAAEGVVKKPPAGGAEDILIFAKMVLKTAGKGL